MTTPYRETTLVGPKPKTLAEKFKERNGPQRVIVWFFTFFFTGSLMIIPPSMCESYHKSYLVTDIMGFLGLSFVALSVVPVIPVFCYLLAKWASIVYNVILGRRELEI